MVKKTFSVNFYHTIVEIKLILVRKKK